MVEDHVRVHLSNDTMFAIAESFNDVAERLMQGTEPFLILTDFYDLKGLLIKREHVAALSWWTNEGAKKYYETDVEISKIENKIKEAVEPNPWE